MDFYLHLISSVRKGASSMRSVLDFHAEIPIASPAEALRFSLHTFSDG